MKEDSLQRIIKKCAASFRVTLLPGSREWEECQRATKTREVQSIMSAAVRERRLMPVVSLPMSESTQKPKGGRRPGAGRPKTGKPRRAAINITLPDEALAKLDAMGGTRSAAINALILGQAVPQIQDSAPSPDSSGEAVGWA